MNLVSLSSEMMFVAEAATFCNVLSWTLDFVHGDSPANANCEFAVWKTFFYKKQSICQKRSLYENSVCGNSIDPVDIRDIVCTQVVAKP